MTGKQTKEYRAGQKQPKRGGVVKSGTQQGTTAKTQGGKTHVVNIRSVNHGRGRR